MTKDEMMQMARDVGALSDNDNDFVHEAIVFSQSALQDLANAILDRAAADFESKKDAMGFHQKLVACHVAADMCRALKIKEGE